jgi:L,D-transpeptidase ErfK/SrfK
MLSIARTIVLATIVAGVPAPASRLTGSIRTYQVAPGDTLVSIGARAGVEPRTLARDNNMRPDRRLRPGEELVLDNRHIAPDGYTDGLVLNVPQRMLFVFSQGEVTHAFPIAVGRATWRTSLGAFAVSTKEVDPVWDVPESIQREMAAAGRRVLTRVGPGPDNPLGRHWLGLTLPGVGIHGTNQPASIFRFTTHGCVRMHPDDIAAVFDLVEVGTPVQFIYEPVLATVADGSVLVEVHPDIYRRIASLSQAAASRLRELGVDHLVADHVLARVAAERAGRAIVVAASREITGSRDASRLPATRPSSPPSIHPRSEPVAVSRRHAPAPAR